MSKPVGIIIGVETEYVVAESTLRPPAARGSTRAAGEAGVGSALRRSDHPLDMLNRALGRMPADDALHRLQAHDTSKVISELGAGMPHLPAERSGIFTSNGGRGYVDCFKAEYSTPETLSPSAAVCHVMAGRVLLADAAARCNAKSKDGGELRIFAQHIDYDPTGSHTWGVHENYSLPLAVTFDISAIRRAIAPHLATRTLFGAGGFSPDPGQPLQFVRSPRAMMLCRSPSIGDCDPMFHARSPSGWAPRRIHLLCCESLRSHVGTYLTYGSTALLIHLAGRNIVAARDFTPLMPRQALARFAADFSGRTRVLCGGGHMRSALEIQQYLCDLAHRARDTGDLDGLPWTDEFLATWNWFLAENARGGREALGRSIDWAIKYDLFDAHCRESAGMSFEQLLAWNRPLARAWRKDAHVREWIADPSQLPKKFIDIIRRAVGPRADVALKRRGLSWEQFPYVLRLRLELRELDWRYGQIGDGVFDRLDKAGVLRHAAPGVTPDAIARACHEPPADTRAKARGDTIAAWAGKKRHAAAKCEWNRITDAGTQEIVNLDDPLNPEATARPWEVSRDGAVQLFERAISLYRTSHFSAAWRLLTRVRDSGTWSGEDPRQEGTFPFRLFRYSAWVAARLGRLDAVDYLGKIHGDTIDAASMFKVADHLYVYRFMGLAPHAKTQQWLGPAEELMRCEPPAEEPLAAAVREHVGAWHLHHGRLGEVEDAIGPAVREECTWRRARIHALRAELYRRNGDVGRAREILDDVAKHVGPPFAVLFAEQITPMQARLAADRSERAILYDQAARVLLRARHPMALARVLLLKARDASDDLAATTIRERVERLARVAASLAQCDLTRSLLARWDQWCSAACAQNLL